MICRFHVNLPGCIQGATSCKTFPKKFCYFVGINLHTAIAYHELKFRFNLVFSYQIAVKHRSSKVIPWLSHLTVCIYINIYIFIYQYHRFKKSIDRVMVLFSSWHIYLNSSKYLQRRCFFNTARELGICQKFEGCFTPPKNSHGYGKPTMNQDVFLVDNRDFFPACHICHVSFQGCS